MLQRVSFLPGGCLFLIHQHKEPGGFSLRCPGQRCLGCHSPAAALRPPEEMSPRFSSNQTKSPWTNVAQIPPIPAVGIRLFPEKTPGIKFRENSLSPTRPPTRSQPRGKLENQETFLFPAVDKCTVKAAAGTASASFRSANAGRVTNSRHQSYREESAL